MPKQVNICNDYVVTCLTWKDLEKLGINSDDIEWSDYGFSRHKDHYRNEENLPFITKQLQNIWYNDWVEQGSTDEGTCTLGNALQINVIPKRCKNQKTLNIALFPANKVQGNVSKGKSSHRALKVLNEKLAALFGNEVKASYFDGNMD